MKLADGKVKFGPWLPDVDDLDNPGLTEATNVIPMSDGSYAPFLTLVAQGSALPSRPVSAFRAAGAFGAGTEIYVGLDSSVYVGDAGAFTLRSSGLTSATFWRFAQYDDQVIVVGDGSNVPQARTLGSGSNLADLATTGTAPAAVQVGVIGQFVVLGGLVSNMLGVQWCAIDDPSDWPTPGTADAVTKQAGLQLMLPRFGVVTGVFGGDQFGIIAQQTGLTRMTYVGGTLVFNFDRYSEQIGLMAANGGVQVGSYLYIIAADGFYRTDGVSLEPIGTAQINSYFYNTVDPGYVYSRVLASVDLKNKTVCWAYPTVGSSGVLVKALLYNYESKRWSVATPSCHALVYGSALPGAANIPLSLEAFDTSFKYGRFSGTPGTAVLTTGEAEFNPGGYTHVQGVKPLVSGASSVAMTVALGERDAQDAAVSYTSESTPHSRTGVAGFRSEHRYHRARTTITGAFTKATGLEFEQVPAGAA